MGYLFELENFLPQSFDSCNAFPSIPRISQFPFVASKRDIEKAIASKPWPVGWSSIGPTAFFENIEMFAPLTKGTFSYAAQGDMKLYWISAADIGEFVCKAFAKPEEYNGKKIEIAGDELSPNEMAAVSC